MAETPSTVRGRTISSERVVAGPRLAKYVAIVITSAFAFWLLVPNLGWIVEFAGLGWEVTEIHSSDQTMIMKRGNRRYTVRCGARCRDFAVGKSYHMRKRGEALEYRGSSYLIIEEEIVFPTTPGGWG